MGKRLCQIIILFALVIFPVTAAAADFNVHINISRQADGAANGEVWYNGNILWRVLLLPDGAKPALVMPGGKTTIIIPDICNGMFLLKVYND
ncbi:MAG: hypothetical protein LLG02_04460 [Pelosinus sp.]|nr:hypothetical protein [Pelosinus sp.]